MTVEPDVAILSTAHGYGSGAETVLAELISGWTADEATIRVVSPRGSRVAIATTIAGVPLVTLRTKRDALANNAIGVLRAVREVRKTALVHAWHSRGFELAFLLGQLLDVPATGSVHDHLESRTHSPIRRWMIRASAKRLDGLVFVSDAVADAWSGVSHNGRVVHNGLVDHRSQRARSDVVRVGFLGMNAAWKGFDIVAGWIARCQGERIQWRLYGEPDAKVKRATALIRAMGEDSVVFAGRRNATDIFDEIDILVHASTQFDPFPTVLLEAARAGVPSVASLLGGSHEIINDGVSGFLFDPSLPESGLAKVRELAKSSDLRAQLGGAARLRYEAQFGVAKMARGYGKFWNGLTR